MSRKLLLSPWASLPKLCHRTTKASAELEPCTKEHLGNGDDLLSFLFASCSKQPSMVFNACIINTNGVSTFPVQLGSKGGGQQQPNMFAYVRLLYQSISSHWQEGSMQNSKQTQFCATDLAGMNTSDNCPGFHSHEKHGSITAATCLYMTRWVCQMLGYGWTSRSESVKRNITRAVAVVSQRVSHPVCSVNTQKMFTWLLCSCQPEKLEMNNPAEGREHFCSNVPAPHVTSVCYKQMFCMCYVWNT